MEPKRSGNKAISSKMDIYGLTVDEIDRIKEVFKKYNQIEEALIYGSRAMCNLKPSSDVDLTLIGSKIDFNLIQQIEFDLDHLLLPYKFDISVYDKISYPEFLDHIQRAGKEFYKKI